MYTSPGELDAHEDYFLTVLGDGIVITCEDCGNEQPFSSWGTRGVHGSAAERY